MSSSTSLPEHEDIFSDLLSMPLVNLNEKFLPDTSIAKECWSDYVKTGLHKKVIPTWIHDVFLSFRREDIRSSFASHLHSSLQNDGINVFIDDRSPERGDLISDSLLQAIEDSQISVVVFSRNYADSRWCLDELQKIMECHRTIGQVVLPVFYDVDPSEVRHQTGEFGKAFQNLLDSISTKVHNWLSVPEEEEYLPQICKHWERRWREVLCEAAGLAGFVGVNSRRNASGAIKDIVENVTRLLDKTDLLITNNLVGVDTLVRDMIQLLNLDIQQSNDVLLLGIWGMGGVGKTTIAKAVYNKIGRNFDGRSFLADIRDVWEQSGGRVYLQEQLLFDICKKTTTKIHSIESGKTILKDRLCHKRVLLVLDNVNTLDQLHALCGSRQWFGPGSRVIITTKDVRLLRLNRVDRVYRMKEMDESESIEIFSWHAFKQASPREDFAEISRNIVEYSGGLPLALEVLGSYLFDRGVTEWECVLEKLKRIPNDQVQKKLKISYDGLNDDTEKEIFLDIACFFIGMDRSDVMHILNGCELHAEIGLSVLVERSLVTIDDKNRIGMHDLLRDMGREIIREKSPKEPEERSRLWFNEDVLDVLSEQIGTEAVEGVALKLPRTNAKCFSTKAFKKMKRLKLLQLAGVQLDGDFEYLSRNLRWLSWNGFPLTCIPTNFYQGNLVFIELANSNMKLVWRETQRMEMLKILNLSHSHYLTQAPDFSNLPNLEKLVLKGCVCSQMLIQMGMNCQVTNILKENILQNMDVIGCGGCLLPGDSYPHWLTFNCKGSSVIFEVPQVEGCILKTMMCIVFYSTPDNTTSDGLKNMLVKNYTKATIQLYERESLASLEGEEGQSVVSSIESGNKVEVAVVFGNGFIVTQTAVYLIYDEPNGEKRDQCHASDQNAIICSGDENECAVRRISPQVEPMDDFVGTASCCGFIKCSFRLWIIGFLHRLMDCWGTSSLT